MPVGLVKKEVDFFSTMCIMPVGLVKTEMASYSLEIGVGMMTSRGHSVDNFTNSGLRAAGIPAQRSRPGADPDLLTMKERAARCGGMTHIRGVLRSTDFSPFISPQRPTVRDFKSCGATTSIKMPLDKTCRPCSGT